MYVTLFGALLAGPALLIFLPAVIALVIVRWPNYARLTRGLVLEAKTNEFKEGFVATDGSRVVNEPEAEAMDASERGQERVQVKKKA